MYFANCPPICRFGPQPPVLRQEIYPQVIHLWICVDLSLSGTVFGSHPQEYAAFDRMRAIWFVNIVENS